MYLKPDVDDFSTWSGEEAFRDSLRVPWWDPDHPLKLRECIRSEPEFRESTKAIIRDRVYERIGSALGCELNPDNRKDKTAAIDWLSEKRGFRSRDNARRLLKSPWDMTRPQVCCLCRETETSLSYLRGESGAYDAGDAAGGGDFLRFIYSQLSYRRRVALWQIASDMYELETLQLQQEESPDESAYM